MSAWLLSLIAIAIVALSLLSGFRRGFVKQLPRLAGLLFGIVCTHIFREPLQQHLMQILPFEQGRPETEFIYSTLACALIFIIVYPVFTFATRLVFAVFKKGEHSIVDSITGALLSLVIYMTFLSLAFNLTICMRPRSELSKSMQHSDANIISEVLLIAPALLGSQSPDELAHLQQLDDARRISI